MMMAAIAGLEPGPRTLRELVWAAEAKMRSEWNHTATLSHLLYNIIRCHAPRLRAKNLEDFHPASQPKPTPIPIEALKALDPRRRRQK